MKILVVDDGLTSRTLLCGILARWGYDVISANDGVEAWMILQQSDAPRLAIVDWVMPRMDGLELCRRVHESVQDHHNQLHTYMILLTARSQKEDIIKGLDAGADDYITKPYDSEELKARVGAACRIVELENSLLERNRRLEDYAGKMETLAKERAQQLLHADRMATIGMLAAGIAHEINNSSTFISGNIQILVENWSVIEEQLKGSVVNQHHDMLALLREEMPNIFSDMKSGIERLTDIVGGLKSYARLDSGKKRPAVINDCINESLKLCQNRLKYSVKLDIRLSENLPKVLADPGQIIQVLVNLFINAADALEMVGGGTLGVNTMLTHERTALSIVVYDTGPGISADVAAHLFNPFFTTKEAGKGTGLGLSISRTIIEEHGGSIAVSRHHQGGAQFTVVLPLTTQPD